MWSSEQAEQMESLALFYQQALTLALGIEAKKYLHSGYHPLTDALAKIMGWRKRWLAASETERTGRAMFLDFLKHVVEALDVYEEWSCAYYRQRMNDNLPAWYLKRCAELDAIEAQTVSEVQAG